MREQLTEIGVRELKTRASEIVRNVRDTRARYVITLRGRPIGLLLPLGESKADAEDSRDVVDQLRRLGQEIAKGWPADVDSGAVLSEMRR